MFYFQHQDEIIECIFNPNLTVVLSTASENVPWNDLFDVKLVKPSKSRLRRPYDQTNILNSHIDYISETFSEDLVRKRAELS